MLVAALGALREMAPTRLRLAGAAAGALAGGAGAAVYALHCPELGAPFVAVWYVLGMATTNAARLLKVDDRTGRLQPGLEADILFLDADPSIDIGALTRVNAVVENGRLHRPEALKTEAQS